MNKLSLEALARQHLASAREVTSGRSAHTVFGGHEYTMRQTLIALLNEQVLSEHENPGEATLHVLQGRVRLDSGENSWEGSAGDLLIVPVAPHSVHALADSVVLLTAVPNK